MIPTHDASELELRDYLAVLRRRKATVALTVVVVVTSALAASFLQTPVYESTAELLLQPRASERIFDPEGDRVAPDMTKVVQTEIEVMKSRSVREAVADVLGSPATVSIQAAGDTEVVEISSESTDADEAARVANAYAETFVSTRRRQRVDDLLAAGKEVDAKLAEIDRQVARLDAPLDKIDGRIAAAAPTDQAALLAERSRLVAETASTRSSLLARRATYAQQLDELDLAGNLIGTGGAQIVSEAEASSSPVRPTPMRNGVVALAIGAVLGVGLAFLRDHLDDSVKSKEDLESATGGATVIGLVPVVPGWRDRRSARVASMLEPTSAAAESYRAMRTSLQFLGLDRPLGVVQVTSAGEGEGKSTTVANLGVALARAGTRVVVVCCDLRRPRLHEFFGLENGTGFTSVLLEDAPLPEALQAVPHEPRLAVLASGPLPPNPSELLSSQRAGQVFAALRDSCDIVLVDCPPVLPVSDSLVLSGLVDGTVVVASAGRTTTKSVGRAVELLAQVGVTPIGSVLNGNGGGASDGYGYGYGYGHSERPKRRLRRRVARERIPQGDRRVRV